jgi:hypothetical protein
MLATTACWMTQQAGRGVAAGSAQAHPPVALRDELVCAGVVRVESAHKLLTRAVIHVGCNQAVRQAFRQ